MPSESPFMLSTLKASRLTAPSLATVGISWGYLAALIPDLKAQTNLDEATLGLVILFAAAGGLIAMYIAPRAISTLKANSPILLAICTALSMTLPGLASGFWSLGAALFCMGISLALLDIITNIKIANLEIETNKPLMNFNHGIFSLSFAFSAIYCGFFRTNGFSPFYIALLSALIICILCIFIIRSKEEISPATEDTPPTNTRLPWIPIFATALIFFAAFIGENALETWTALFFEDVLEVAAGKGSVAPFAFGLMMAISRFSAQKIVQIIGPEKLVLYSGLFGAFGAFLLSFASTPSVALIAICITAAGLSTIVPNGNTVLAKFAHNTQRSLVLSRAWMIGFVGFFVGPSMVGFIAHATNLRIAFMVVACLVALTIPAILIILSQQKKLKLYA